jgi:glycosyltransferase involved in cell wall biosynthesis
MKVSVLMPIYNAEQYLSECLDSIVSQDFTDMEILVSDNQSTDGTLKIIKGYAARDARIRWWQNPKNLGLTDNHNVCLLQAKGEYVKYIHADDKLLSASAIRKMVAVLDEHPNVVLVGSRQHLTGSASRPTVLSDHSGRFDGRRMIVTCLEQNANLIGQPTLTLFRRSAAQHGFDDRFVGHLDYTMWCHLLEQGDFFYLAEDLATWRVHENQQTAMHEKTGAAHHEHLVFLETYYAKSWLQKAATDQMLFTQIYYLKKKYGRKAGHLTTAMMLQLSSRRYVWLWLRHKAIRPFQKLSRKLRLV